MQRARSAATSTRAAAGAAAPGARRIVPWLFVRRAPAPPPEVTLNRIVRTPAAASAAPSASARSAASRLSSTSHGPSTTMGVIQTTSCRLSAPSPCARTAAMRAISRYATPGRIRLPRIR
ncbi:putative polyketide synthase PksJ [Burkholderia pseudomallei MSHR5608]|nr:putative polyketide synthase PksJ [Burkholderia pseudomallei MSHR5608]